MKVEYININELSTYPQNVKIHTAEQIEQIKKSIKDFGFNDPIAIWKDGEIIEGHGRYIAATELGMKEVPVIRLDSLTEDKKKAYALVHNKLTTDTRFDTDVLADELSQISEYDMPEYGFEIYGDFDTNEFYEDDKVAKVTEVICEKCGEHFFIDANGRVVE